MRLLALFALFAFATALSTSDLFTTFCHVTTEQAKEGTTAEAFANAVFSVANDLCKSVGVELKSTKFEAFVRRGNMQKPRPYESCIGEMPTSNEMHEGCKRWNGEL